MVWPPDGVCTRGWVGVRGVEPAPEEDAVLVDVGVRPGLVREDVVAHQVEPPCPPARVSAVRPKEWIMR